MGEATISQLQSNKKDVSEVLNGNECGIRIDTTITPLEGDMIDIYLAEENKRVLEPVS